MELILFGIGSMLCFALGWFGHRQEVKHQRDQELADLQYKVATTQQLLDNTQNAVSAKDVIIQDLVEHCDALNREIDALQKAKRGAA